jgi:hypothetical protein
MGKGIGSRHVLHCHVYIVVVVRKHKSDVDEIQARISEHDPRPETSCSLNWYAQTVHWRVVIPSGSAETMPTSDQSPVSWNVRRGEASKSCRYMQIHGHDERKLAHAVNVILGHIRQPHFLCHSHH